MANNYFSFKQFTVFQDKCSFKSGTDGVLLGAYTDVSHAEKVLDIGTGTGLIALMIAQRCKAVITAIEPDLDSYEQACENAMKSDWSKRIKIENVDLQNFNPAGEKFDLIVTNPPFFKDSLKNPDSRKATARHNDTLSSDEILKGVSRLLAENGMFQIILPYVEGNIFIAETQEYGLFCNNILKIRPLPTAHIRRLILGFSRKRSLVIEKFLTIECGKRHEFTEDYVSLTKDFYMNF
jgi:tRNA1Val (adenine37-N6)-methyltransferase